MSGLWFPLGMTAVSWAGAGLSIWSLVKTIRLRRETDAVVQSVKNVDAWRLVHFASRHGLPEYRAFVTAWLKAGQPVDVVKIVETVFREPKV